MHLQFSACPPLSSTPTEVVLVTQAEPQHHNEGKVAASGKPGTIHIKIKSTAWGSPENPELEKEAGEVRVVQA